MYPGGGVNQEQTVLFCFVKLLRDNKLTAKTFLIVFMCFPDTNREESSAYSISLQGTDAPISLTYIKKMMRPQD